MRMHLQKLMTLRQTFSTYFQQLTHVETQLNTLERQAANPILQLTRFGGNNFAANCSSPSSYQISADEKLTVELMHDQTQTLELSQYASRDSAPIPAPSDREGYAGENHRGYWETGLVDFVKVRDLKSRILNAEAPKMLDLGCSSGRFVRHLAAHEPSWQSYACDIDAMHIQWVKTFLPRTIIAFQNTIYPNLPLPDSSFDIVTAFSVFTHIDQLEDAWLLEIRRILRPGGIFYLSVHTERVWKRIASRPEVLAILSKCRPQWSVPQGIEVTEASFLDDMPENHIILRYQDGGAYGAQTFHSEQFIRDNWGRLFDIMEIHDGYHIGFQDVVVLQKPS